MDFIRMLEHLGKRFAAKRQEAVEQLESDVSAVRYARRNQEDAALGQAVFGLYIESEQRVEKLERRFQLIQMLIEEALENE